MSNRAERRNMREVVNNRSLDERVKTNSQIVIIMAIFAFAGFVCSLLNLLMLTQYKKDADEAIKPVAWVECTLPNDVGYSVVADWQTSGYDNTVVFTPSETEVFTVASASLLELNGTQDIAVKCTNETFDEFIKYTYAYSMSETNIFLDSYNSEHYPVLGTKGRLIKTTQYAEEAGVRVPTYSTALYFIYEEYLYTFTYTVAARNYIPEEFEKILASIRVIPESEMQLLTPDKEAAQNIIAEYGELFAEFEDKVEDAASNMEGNISDDNPSSQGESE